MVKTGITFPDSPEEDIFQIARFATAEIDTATVISEFDKTVYEIGRTAFYEIPAGDSIAVQLRCETDVSNNRVENYDLLVKDKEKPDSWRVLATVNNHQELNWNRRAGHIMPIEKRKSDTRALFKFVADSTR